MRKAKHHKVQKALRKGIDTDYFHSRLFYLLVILVIIFAALIVINVNLENPPQVIKAVSSENGFLEGDTVDSNALSQFNKNYQQVRSESGEDFYVYFEDSSGNTVKINGQKCFGSPQAKQLDSRCR